MNILIKLMSIVALVIAPHIKVDKDTENLSDLLDSNQSLTLKKMNESDDTTPYTN